MFFYLQKAGNHYIYVKFICSTKISYFSTHCEMRRMKVLFSIFCTLIITISYAQKNDVHQEELELSHYNIYFGTSSGINNMNGIMGGNIEVRSSDKTSISGALGLGLWGIKGSAYFKYYKTFPVCFYYGLGYSWHSGIKNFSMGMLTNEELTGIETTQQEEEFIEYNFLQVSTINIICGHQWSFSKDHLFRFYVEGGVALPLRKKPYEILTPEYINDEDTLFFLETISPGGFILGAGVSIGF